MSDPHTPPLPVEAQLAALAERVEAAVLEGTRDLKTYYTREFSLQLAQIEERFEKRIAKVEAELQGIGVKLTAIRQELHQTIRDQTLRFGGIVTAIVAFGIAALLLSTRKWG